MSTPRTAAEADIPAIEELIAASARGLCSAEYTSAQIEAALGTAWGCDSELVRDGTYFVIEVNGRLAACGGWGFRKTLFGADGRSDRESELMNPESDAARIRAFFVHPDFARRGLGRALLAHSEAAARAKGFRAAELMATLTGIPLYAACGYAAGEPTDYPLPGGPVIRFVPMRKALA